MDLFFDGKQPCGFQKTSMVDYPGKVSAVIFFPFCNMRCPWCHNGALITNRRGGNLTPLGEALSHIEKRRPMLGGVTLSGGEASLYPHLAELIAYIKRLDLPVKLDTNGLFPQALEKILPYPETRPGYIAMDLKLSPLRYAGLMANPRPGTETEIAGRLERSAAVIRASGVEHEFRSLRLPAPYFTEADIEALRPLAQDSPWRWRPLIRGNCLDPAWNLPEGFRA